MRARIRRWHLTDGCQVFSAAFLDEAFGALDRLPEMPSEEALKILDIRHSGKNQSLLNQRRDFETKEISWKPIQILRNERWQQYRLDSPFRILIGWIARRYGMK